MKRINSIKLILLLSFAVLQYGGCFNFIPAIDSEVSSERFSTDHFIIEWHNTITKRPCVVVKNNVDQGRVLWATIPGDQFIHAVKSEIDVTENRGSFTVDEKVLAETGYQSVDEISSDDGTVIISGKVGTDEDDGITGYSLAFTEISAGHLQFKLTLGEGSDYNVVKLVYQSSRYEKFFGFGEQYTYLNLKGHRVPIIVQEGGIGRGYQPFTDIINLFSPGSGGNAYTTYCAMPYYITSTMRGLFLENLEYSEFDLTLDNEVAVKVFSTTLTGRILNGNTPLDLIEQFTEYAGRMKALPDWLNNGAVIGMQGGTDEVYAKLDLLKQNDTPIGAFWLQDWVNKRKTMGGLLSQLWWNWVLDREWYENWDEMADDLEAEGIKIMTYINPYLVNASEKGDLTRNLYQEALDNGYFVKNESGGIYQITNTDFDAGIIDLTNPEAWNWYRDVIRVEMIGTGASGWMSDYAESLPFDAVLYSGEDAASYHNRFPVEWARLNREAIAMEGMEGEAAFFSRSGFTRNPGFSTFFFLGDQWTGWDGCDGFKSAIKGLLSGGISGLSMNHSDIGGYTTVGIIGLSRGRELFKRWAEANAFTAVYRTHEGSDPSSNIQFYTDNDTLRHFAKFAKVYHALAPYRRELMVEAETKGYPLVRHPMLHYPEDQTTHDLQYQYMLGSEFMIAPVVKKWDRTVRVYLPAGKWIHLWSGTEYGNGWFGSWVVVDAPLGKPGVFYKKNSSAGIEIRETLQGYGIIN